MSYQRLQVGRAAAVTTSDTVDIPSVNGGTRNEGPVLYVGGTGNVRVLTEGGDDVIFYNVQGGTFLPVHVIRVFNTNTTATNIVALW